jgi:penicillin-binding protein 1A
VEDRSGDMLYRADGRDCPACSTGFSGDDGPELQPTGPQLIDPITAYQIDTMLEGVVLRGTAAAAAAHFPGRPLGGKTGTTNEFRSAWFVGFSPQLVVGTFVGFDDNRSLGKGETGAQAALPIFIEFMQEAVKGLPPVDFKAPPDTRFAQIGPNREAFRPGTEPRVVVAQPAEGVLPDQMITPLAPGTPGPAAPGAPPPGAPKADKPPKPPDDLRVPF